MLPIDARALWLKAWRDRGQGAAKSFDVLVKAPRGDTPEGALAHGSGCAGFVEDAVQRLFECIHIANRVDAPVYPIFNQVGRAAYIVGDDGWP